jgi:hypothetical protein
MYYSLGTLGKNINYFIEGTQKGSPLRQFAVSRKVAISFFNGKLEFLINVIFPDAQFPWG